MSYIVVDIGCLECHNPSELIGVFDTIEQAKAAESQWNRPPVWDDEPGWHSWGGLAVIAIFDADTRNVVSIGSAR